MYASIDLINLRPSKQILQPTENWKILPSACESHKNTHTSAKQTHGVISNPHFKDHLGPWQAIQAFKVQEFKVRAHQEAQSIAVDKL